ncbi:MULTISPECIES: LexA family transcriptional regulator [Niastella]|uniref:LexA family transcriptional regulator n=1 Tax=Niastella soli TaxID=2821487 RepID=A0ABS3YSV3_9BACT|nr:LexA family transcriptional regulator [Niastella soli]MBO9200999.1 LexA family transcriptional regulator [Niastella soli]
MDNHIGQRLKAFREKSKIKMPAIAAQTGIAKETLYKWEKGTKPSDINDYFRLKSYLNKMEGQVDEELLEQDYQMPTTLRLPLSPNRLPVPQTDGKFASGTIFFFNNEPELIVDRLNAPFLGPLEGAIEVNGESMAPTFSSGCRVVIFRLNNYRILDWGAHYYIIDKNWQGSVRRVYEGQTENSLRLVSDNPNQDKFPPIQRQWDHIEAIFRVIAGIWKL